MKSFIYTIFDRVAEESGPVFEATNDGVALRNFKNLLRDTPEYQKGDYRLYRLGNVDHASMKMEVYPQIDEVLTSGENDA